MFKSRTCLLCHNFCTQQVKNDWEELTYGLPPEVNERLNIVLPLQSMHLRRSNHSAVVIHRTQKEFGQRINSVSNFCFSSLLLDSTNESLLLDFLALFSGQRKDLKD